MPKFTVLDGQGSGGRRFWPQERETQTVQAADEIEAARLTTGFIGQFTSTKWGAAEGCWLVMGTATADQLHDVEGNEILKHPGIISVTVVRTDC